jgi:aminoglycoside 2'-N-acetyltransferase I
MPEQPDPKLTVVPSADVSADQLRALRGLLDSAFGDRFSDDDWEHCLGGWHVVLASGATLLSHAAVVSRDLQVGDQHVRAGYVEAVATAPGHQQRGLGSRLMNQVNTLIRQEFDLGALSTHRWAFYERLGWERWQGPSFVRHGDRWTRTAGEDAGIMVLRSDRSLDLDLPISCEQRRGDDW